MWRPNWRFQIGPGSPGAQKGPTEKKRDRRPQSHRNFGRFTSFSGFLHKRAGSSVSPSALQWFSVGDLKTGPNRDFVSKTQQLYGKRVTWVHSARPEHRSFWVSRQKWNLHFGPLGPEKRPKRPVLGHRREKPNRRLRRHRNFGRFTPWNHPD